MSVLKIIANFLIILGLILIASIFWPVAKEEIKYTLNQAAHVQYSLDTVEEGAFEKPLTVPNIDFSIAIPKIGAVAPVVENVDSQNKIEYLQALKQGVAHAKGTALPTNDGNVYIFAHSTDAFYNVGKYNAVFYLLGKLTKGDSVFIYYKGRKIEYLVDQVKIVKPEEVSYLAGNSDKNTLTLQTCYPPGTTFERLIVIANQVELQ